MARQKPVVRAYYTPPHAVKLIVMNPSMNECGAILAGDLNLDGTLNVLDVVLMVNLVLDDGYDYAADMNGDGIINVLDIVTLINTILN